MAKVGAGPLSTDYRPCRPTERDGLLAKIAELHAFERTPAGAALKAYRGKITVAVMNDEGGTKAERDACWAAVRAAESGLIAEIKRLQCAAT